MLRCFNDMGYSVEWRVINAAEYGQAQRRRRVFIFAFHETTTQYKKFKEAYEELDGHAKWITSIGFFASTFPVYPIEHVDPKKVVEHPIDETMYETLLEVSDNYKAYLYSAGVMFAGNVYSAEVKPQFEKPITLGEIRINEHVPSNYFLGQNLEKWKYLKGAKKIPRVKPNGEDYFYSEGGMNFPDALDAPGRTLLTSESSVNRSTHVIEDLMTNKLRVLTPIECERLNGFPDNWTNTGMPEKFRYFTMGNALVVPLVTRMGQQLLKFFD